MPGDRRRGRGNRGYNRRKVLLAAGGLSLGGLSIIKQSGAFTSVVGSRSSSIEVASQGDGIVGINPEDTVKKNSRDPLVEFENNYGETVTITVTLQDGSDGTLYDPASNTGDTITFTLADATSEWVDLEASVTGTVPYDVSISSTNFGLNWSGSTEAESGNKPGAVDIRSPNKDQDFTAYKNRDEWEIKSIDVRDNDGDNDLDRIEIEITENSTNDIVATKTIEPIPGDKYAPGGSPDAVIKPDDSGYNVTNGMTYNLDFKAYDDDGNFASASLDDDA